MVKKGVKNWKNLKKIIKSWFSAIFFTISDYPLNSFMAWYDWKCFSEYFGTNSTIIAPCTPHPIGEWYDISPSPPNRWVIYIVFEHSLVIFISFIVKNECITHIPIGKSNICIHTWSNNISFWYSILSPCVAPWISVYTPRRATVHRQMQVHDTNSQTSTDSRIDIPLYIAINHGRNIPQALDADPESHTNTLYLSTVNIIFP